MVKESQSRMVAPSLDTHIGCRVGGVTRRRRKRRVAGERPSGSIFDACGEGGCAIF